ncbi:MAG: hypothetical protein M3203_12430, partial [Actinomycetota bacterium]|nr:hypothetical protein [Actinomycetota bacterium]
MHVGDRRGQFFESRRGQRAEQHWLRRLSGIGRRNRIEGVHYQFVIGGERQTRRSLATGTIPILAPGRGHVAAVEQPSEDRHARWVLGACQASRRGGGRFDSRRESEALAHRNLDDDAAELVLWPKWATIRRRDAERRRYQGRWEVPAGERRPVDPCWKPGVQLEEPEFPRRIPDHLGLCPTTPAGGRDELPYPFQEPRFDLGRRTGPRLAFGGCSILGHPAGTEQDALMGGKCHGLLETGNMALEVKVVGRPHVPHAVANG